MVRTLTVTAFDDWRPAARALLGAGVPPAGVLWVDAAARQPGLLPDAPLPPAAGPPPTVPRGFVELARRVACHRDPERWSLLYRALWRLTHDDPRLLERAADPDVVALRERDAAVRREAHKTKAFVRFRRVETPTGDEAWVAWHRPLHPVLPLVGAFFADRFASMRWTILTPDAALSWDGERLHAGPGVPRREAPDADALEALWCRYYAHTFNPARVNLAAMRAEMPVHHWATLPETAIIGALVRAAPERLREMAARARPSAAAFVPAVADDARALPVLADAAAGCTACPLHADATATVFGEGPPDARLVIVGEQPGDAEDHAGRPFVGPAGQLLDRALEAAGIAREQVYFTNAVKHFRHRANDTPRGPRRLHARPGAAHVAACRPWLDAELAAIRPAVAVALGATAAHALIGRATPVEAHRGDWHRNPAVARGVRVTWHPAAILRARDPARATALFTALVDDLRAAAEAAAEAAAG